MLVDLEGAVKTIEAAQQTGVNRFIMVSALQAHKRENWNEKIRHYYVAKHYADRILKASGLIYTIVRPGRLTNEPGSGRVEAQENLERNSISREDVAHTVFVCLQEKHTHHRSFDLISGETPIEEAIKTI